MKEFILFLLVPSIFGSETTASERNSTRIGLIKDLHGHLDYLLTILPSEKSLPVKDFLLLESKVAGDFTRSWTDRQSSIVKYIEQDRKVQDWLKTWRSGENSESADYFINAAENYKNPAGSLELIGSDLMNKVYSLLFDDNYRGGNTEKKKEALWNIICKIDSQCPNDCAVPAA